MRIRLEDSSCPSRCGSDSADPELTCLHLHALHRSRLRGRRPRSGPPPTGVISAAAPVFLLPDATRTPLRTLAAGTSDQELEEEGKWIRVEFNDGRYGPPAGLCGAAISRGQ